MDQVRDSDTPTEQLMRFLESTRVDDDVVSGDYSPAKVDTPNVPDVDELPVKTASTSEDDESNALEVKSGTAESGEGQGWYKVEFSEPFSGQLPPSINATAVQRTGDFSQAEYQPPSFQVSGVELIEVSDIQLGQIQAGRVDGAQISIGQVSVGKVEVAGVKIGDIEVTVPQIQERRLQHQADISQDGISITTPQLGQSIDFGKDLDINVDFSFDERNFDEDLSGKVDYPNLDNLINEIEEFDPKQGTKSLENLMKEGSREGAAELYDIMEQNLPDALNIETLNVMIKDEFLDAWDFALQRVYGKGDTEYNGSFNGGEGVYESAYGFIGSVIDDALDFIVEELVGFDRDTLEQTNADLIQMRDEMVGSGGVIDTLEDIIGNEIEDLIDDELGNLDKLKSESSNNLQSIGSEVERVTNSLQSEIDEQVVTAIEQLQQAVNDYAENDVQGSFESIDASLRETEKEIGNLSTETSDQMQLLGEDVNVAFTDVTQQLQDEINVVNDELQVSVNDTLAQTIGGVNDELVNLQEQTNDALIVTQEDTNAALDDVVAETNAALEDIQVQTNDSMVTVEEEVNASFDEINANNEDLQQRTNSALSEVTAQAETAVNESLTLLYDTMGMPKGELMVPIQTRNVTKSGFEFLGYEGGTEIHWTAMSRSGSGNIVEGPDDGSGQIGEGKIRDIVRDEIENLN